MSSDEVDERRMFMALAALAYRGFADVGPEAVERSRIGDLIRRGLDEVPVLRGRWALAYGPVTHRSLAAVFDDALLYAVRNTQDPHQIVIVLRGTNPIGMADWVLGDFLVGMQVAWPYGGAARVSLSTAIGLSIVRQMRDAVVSPGPLGRLWTAIGSAGAAAEVAAFGGVRAMVEWAESAPSAERLRALYHGLTSARNEQADLPDHARIERLHRGWASELQHELFEHIARALCDLEDHCAPALLALVEGRHRAGGSSAGLDLRSLLAGFVEHAGGAPVDVVVTGHSKAGALAQAVALWLADTRGDGAGAERAWDPQGLATVRCFSYASPTAGDAAFAERAAGVLGDGLHRIVNPLDVVPCTWSTTDLARIAALYGNPVAPLPGLGPLVELISASVEPLGYCHVPVQKTLALPAALDPARRSFMDQMAHQHLESYLAALSLDLDVFE